MKKLFKILKKKNTENTSFIRNVTYNIITYTVEFENVEYIKEWFNPGDIAYINYNPRGEYFVIGIIIK